MQKIKIAVIQTAIPEYRQDFFLKLKKYLNSNSYTTFADYKSFNNIFYKEVDSRINFIKIKNIFFFNCLLFQYFNYLNLKKYEVIVIDNNFRNISNFIIFLFAKIFKKKLFIWGHLPNKKFISFFKYFLINHSSGYICYTDKDKKLALRYINNHIPICSINNSCVSKDICSFTKSSKDLIFIGRLDDDKNPLFLINIFNSLLKIDNFNKNTKLHIIGYGHLEKELLTKINNNKLSNNIILHGKIVKDTELKKIFRKSIITLNPGTIGLSAMHSFAFGNFIISKKNLKHGPELFICNNDNSFLFESLNANEWANFINDKINTLTSKDHKVISEIISTKYNLENMADNFNTFIQNEFKKQNNQKN